MSLEMDIKQIQSDLVKLGSESTSSEAHGILCGVLCGRSDIEAWEWLSLTVDAYDAIEPGDLLAREASESLSTFFLATVAALSDDNLKFYPLLAEDESEVVLLESIAQWAQGYLMGLSLAGIKTFSDYPEDVTEFVEAMASISKADDYDLAGDDSDEAAMVELIEFIRIGVLLMNEEMNPVRMPVDSPSVDSPEYK